MAWAHVAEIKQNNFLQHGCPEDEHSNTQIKPELLYVKHKSINFSNINFMIHLNINENVYY